ncbi:hypothetical protein Fcan01_01087 [Folsomia candida]|uniref:Uncharacterized protein n=1 Tax=Folsomia candida TaxID=158441 RepID=A0A226F6E4_FOLCA|nr:hypothetical protein Fcan01_01087 [Folsomia candida]
MSSIRSVNSTLNSELNGWKELKSLITSRHGPTIMAQIKDLEKMEIKTTKLQNDNVFLKRCKKNNIIPHGLRIKNQWLDIPSTRKRFQKLEQDLLKDIINYNYGTLAKLKREIDDTKTQILTICTEHHHAIFDFINTSKLKYNTEVKQKQINKFDRLQQTQKLTPRINSHPHPSIHVKRSSIVNLSNKTLTEDETEILELGLNYAVPLRNQSELIVESGISLECCLQDLEISEEKKDCTKRTLKNIVFIQKSTRQQY